MSDFQEGANPAPDQSIETHRDRLDNALNNVVNNPNLTPEQQDKEVEFLADAENKFANEGKLPGTEASATAASGGREVVIDKNGVVHGSREQALGEEKVE